MMNRFAEHAMPGDASINNESDIKVKTKIFISDSDSDSEATFRII